jgi:hypothetical protein
MESVLRGWDTQYAPAMTVLLQQRVPEYSRRFLEQIHGGETLIWDEGDLATQTWAVYAGIACGVAQVTRLLGRQLEFDRWGEARRISLATLPWDNLPYGFGWKVACRPFGGVEFANEPWDMSPVKAMPYINSWPHGYLTHDELRRFRGPLREEVHATLARMMADEDPPPVDADTLESLLDDPRSLSHGTFVDLFGFGAAEDVWQWRTRRALILLRAIDGALEIGKDLVCVGY